MFSRRDMLAATAAGGVVTAATMTTANATPVITPVKSDIAFGNPNDPPQGAINAKNPRSVTDPGPQNPAIRDQFPCLGAQNSYAEGVYWDTTSPNIVLEE
jgi:oxalate decarboxylase